MSSSIGLQLAQTAILQVYVTREDYDSSTAQSQRDPTHRKGEEKQANYLPAGDLRKSQPGPSKQVRSTMSLLDLTITSESNKASFLARQG